MRPTGEQVMLQAKVKPTDEGVCFFLPGLTLPDRVKVWPDLILLDLRFGKWVRRTADLTKWANKHWKSAGIVGLYTVGDRDTLSALTAAGFADLPLDHRAISTCIDESSCATGRGPGHVVDWQLDSAAQFLDRSHEVHQIGDNKLNDQFLQVVGLLEQHAQKQSPDLNRARWLLATLTQLPVPVTWYDGVAANRGRSTLSRLIDGLGARSRVEDGLGAVCQSLKLLLLDLLASLLKDNPRAAALKDLLPKLNVNSSSETVQVFVRDRICAQALDSWLAVEAFPGAEWLPSLQIQACAAYYQVPGRTLAASIVNGAFPHRYRWLAGAALGGMVHFLAYPHEIDIIERQLQSVYAAPACDDRRRKRESAIALALSYRTAVDNRSESARPELKLKRPQSPTVKPKRGDAVAFRGGLAELGYVWETAQKVAEREKKADEEPAWLNETPEETQEAIDLSAGEDSSTYSKACVLLHLHSHTEGPGTILIPAEAVVDCMRLSVDEELLRVSARDIKVGDVMLLLGENKRAGLFEIIVDLAECQPAMQYLAAFRRQWRVAVQVMAAKFFSNSAVDYGRLLQTLRSEGATVRSEEAVRLWVRDQIIGPETVESIRAVGLVARNQAVSGQAREFQRAFKKIRGIRRGIGHRLSAVIRSSFKHLAAGADIRKSDALEDRLGIPLDELLETIDVAEVVGIGAPATTSSGHHVGRFIRSDRRA
jgi:hypothetical protein